MKKKEENIMVRANLKVILPAMAESGMPQKEIAEKAGVNPGTVSRIKSGYLVRLDRLGRVCKVLGIPASEGMIIEQ